MHFQNVFTALVATAVTLPSVLGAQLTKVSYPNNATSKVDMYIYIPDNLAPSPPPLIIVLHSCQSTAQSYFRNAKIPWASGSDKKGYITIWPSSPHSGTCWDVSSRQSLTHLGGGDSQAIANMIIYAMDKYKTPVEKVFVTGGSSGAMMANVLAATYPQLISAVSAYSGVAAGCFVSSSGGVASWNNSCSGGSSRASAQQWGNTARNMFPGYEGRRPRMQIWHGSADGTISPNNYGEQVKQWTNVLGVPGAGGEGGGTVNGAPKGNTERRDWPAKGYTTSDYTDKEGVVWVEGIWAQGVGHSVPANLSASEAWFGL